MLFSNRMGSRSITKILCNDSYQFIPLKTAIILIIHSSKSFFFLFEEKEGKKIYSLSEMIGQINKNLSDTWNSCSKKH